jgi:glucose/arabinose dehydrogenase
MLAAQVDDSLRCEPDNGGLTLPEGFCAILVAEDLPGPRHLAVRGDGMIFVAAGGRRDGTPGGIYALADTDGDGRADDRVHFGEEGGNGLVLDGEYLYFAPNDKVVRYRIPAGEGTASGEPDVIVGDLPSDRSHRAKSIALDEDGNLFVNIGSPSNVCQPRDRAQTTGGVDPCPELETRAGVWRFDANRSGQTQADGERYGTGIRNAVALTYRPATEGLYAVVHGRDRLFQLFPEHYNEEDGAEKPAEEFIRIEAGDDFGWPYCYYDPQTRVKVLAPEYGGDGSKTGRCTDAKDPIFGFPGHWAPDGLLFYTGTQFPEQYWGGAFVAFHGSWNRAPRPQAGYNVTFLPLQGDRSAGPFEVFADGFIGAGSGPQDAQRRPVGLAQGPDGSVYVTDDREGTLWRIIYRREG